MVLLPEQGRLEDTAFPTLLLDLHSARFCGLMRLTRDRVEKRFSFREGIPVFAESNLTSESLGVQLMDAGAISRSDYSRVVREVEQKGCKEGKALLDLGLIEPRGLFLALKEQVRQRLIECFGWAHGRFLLESNELPPDETQPFRADIYPLLQEGIETHWSTDRVLADLEPHLHDCATRTTLVSRIQHRLRSDAALESFIDALDGRQPLWMALRRATTPRALAGAWLLDAIDALEYRDAALDEKDEEEELPDLEIVFASAGERAERPRAAAKPAAAPADADARALRHEIAQKFAALDELDYYELLGVPRTAELTAIKRSYLVAAKSYHPDALARMHIDGDVREHANKVFGEIGKAYGVLSNPKRRREYDASLKSESLGMDADRIARAETLYRKGEILLRQGNFRGAAEFLVPAVEIYPDECDYQNAAGWALYKKMPSEPERAKAHLESAAKLKPDDGIVLYRLGVVLRALGETVASAALLAKAKELDPMAG